MGIYNDRENRQTRSNICITGVLKEGNEINGVEWNITNDFKESLLIIFLNISNYIKGTPHT